MSTTTTTTTEPKIPERVYLNRLITLEEAVILCAYPVTMILGWLVSVANPQETYFSDKKNIFNVVFVRQGWFWTTLAFVAISFSTLRESTDKLTTMRHHASRWAVATVWWFLFAQWCFGLPLMDRVFVLTGGSCQGVEGAIAMSSATCRSKGGAWTGGYDPSGHLFLLAHASLFLWFELLPVIQRQKPVDLAVKFTLLILALWWWMLLMTSIYFHSFFEKLAGLIWGGLEILFVYVYSRVNGSVAHLFGIP